MLSYNIFVTSRLTAFTHGLTAMVLSGSFDRGKKCSDVYNQYYPLLKTLKSSKAFYNAGKSMAKNFPHLLKKEKVTLLYPAAAAHIAVINTTMALIENGANEIKIIMTDLDEANLEYISNSIKEWSQANPSLIQTSEDWKKSKPRHPQTQRNHLETEESENTESSAQRANLELSYLGKKIEIEYAINDANPSYQDLYFDPLDLDKSDIVVIHDPYSETGETDTSFLKQILPHISPLFPKVILMPDESQSHKVEHLKKSAVKLRSIKIEGSFGHSGSYPVNKVDESGIYWKMKEIGQAAHPNAIMFSTKDALIKAAVISSGTNQLVDLLQLAGGEDQLALPDIPREVKIDSDYLDLSRHRGDAVKPVSKYSSGEEKYVPVEIKLAQWADQNIENLTSKEDQDFLALLCARMILMNISDYENITENHSYQLSEEAQQLFPPRLKAHISRAFKKHGLYNPFGDSKIVHAKLEKVNLKKLDKALSLY